MIRAVLTAGLALYLLATPCLAEQAKKVRAVKVRAVGALSGLGSVRCLRSLELGFAINGVLAQVLVEEGDLVSRGQVLARLETGQQQARIRAQKAEVDRNALEVGHLSRELGRKRQLAKGRVISQSDLAEARFKLAKSRASLRLAKAELATLLAELKSMVLRAPHAGLVAQVHLRAGEVAGPSRPKVIRLEACRQVLAEVELGERFYNRVRPGMAVVLRADALPGQAFRGSVARRSPVIDDKDRTFKVKVLVDNPGLQLRPGMFVRASLSAGITVLPLQALLARRGQAGQVFVVKDGVAVKRNVSLGRTMGQSVLVHQGLNPGEVVVLDHEGLKELSEVTVILPKAGP